MHIPDGYISPETAGSLWAIMVPVWYTASRKVRAALSSRLAPLIAISAAFTFVVMMFNVPVPGGTSGHMVGGTIVALAIGPWAAVIALTVALAIQALFFGDGGVLALAANSFNVAFALPVTGYYVYRLLAAGAPAGGWRRWLAAGIGAYAGINVGALLAAFETGIQPALFHAADGSALYAPYGLSQAVPAIMAAHLTVIGFIEAAVTCLAVAWLQRTHGSLLESWRPGGAYTAGAVRALDAGREEHSLRGPLVGLLLLAVFVPLGLLAGTSAWGEWSPAQLGDRFGAVPAGMERFAGLWGGLLPDYGAGGSFMDSLPGYLLSGALGIAAAAAVSMLVVRLLTKKKNVFQSGHVRETARGTPIERHNDPAFEAAVMSPGQRARPGLIPAWMRQPQTENSIDARRSRRRDRRTVEHTLAALSGALRENAFFERLAGERGLLQRMDPRAKLLATVVLLVAAAVVGQPLLLLALYGGLLAAAWSSGLPLAFFIRRVWLFIPMFAGVIVLPEIFNVVKSGDPVVTLWNFGHEATLGPWSLGSSLAITSQGLESAGLLVLRVAVSVSLVVLLVTTTRWSDLLKALRVFYIPRVFVLVLSMAYRYIFLLAGIALDMFTARRSRQVAPLGAREDRRFVASGAGALLGKSHSFSEEVYMAMLSRGYTGEVRTMSRMKVRVNDALLLAGVLLSAVMLVGGDRLLG